MSLDRRDVLQILRYELNFLEQGGSSQENDTARARSPFQGNLTCINFGDPLRRHACRECPLYEFVPEASRAEEVPCHFIPVSPKGATVGELLASGDAGELNAALRWWLRQQIAQLALNT